MTAAFVCVCGHGPTDHRGAYLDDGTPCWECPCEEYHEPGGSR